MALAHPLERIDIIGRDGIVIGEDAEHGLGFTTVRLDGAAPRLGGRFVLKDAGQGESRSHAFFYHPDASSPDGSSGLLGLPVMRGSGAEGSRLLGSAASILFLSRQQGELAEAGELTSSAGAGALTGDRCKASCTDWYGNARPIFVGDRVFALLGYELVEGGVQDAKVNEAARADFGPAPPVERPGRSGALQP